MSDRIKIKRHSFKPGAMSIIQMGEELIGHPSTAINELVKNGYDADALSCKVFFNYSNKKQNSFVLIYDDGLGMNKGTLFGNWLQPSMSSKRGKNTRSKKFKRNFLGSKGIGRLAAMALGEKITVISKTEKDIKYNWLTVDREAFRTESLLSQIKFPGDQVDNYNILFEEENYLKERKSSKNEELILILNNNISFNRGTLIIIEGVDDAVLKILYDDYSQREKTADGEKTYKDTQFYKALATLITPLHLNETIQNELYEKKIISKKKSVASVKNDFTLSYSTNLLPDTNKKEIEWLNVDPIPIQSVYDYRVYGKVDSSGTVKGYMNYSRLENEIFESEFIIQENRTDQHFKRTLFDELLPVSEGKTGEYYFDIRVYDIGENDNLTKLANLSKLPSPKAFKDAFKSFQGLRISKNGFGVKPYGEEVEDWVGLSKARVQNPGQNVNTNQILGYIFFFSPENDNLEEKTNREGFLENKSFQQVKETVKTIFSYLGKERYNYRLEKGLGRPIKSKHQRPDFENFYRMLSAKNASQEILALSKNFMKEVNTSMDNLEESLSFSERLASLGSGVELIYHEMAQPLAGLHTVKNSLNLKKGKIAPEILSFYLKDLNILIDSTTVLVKLRDSLQPAIGRTRKKNFKIYNTFKKVCNLYKADIEQFNIKIKTDHYIEELELMDLEYAFWITFLNIINNAIYWLKHIESNREIRLYLEKGNIVIANSGPLIRQEILDFIFEYGVTTRVEKNATGLGLAFSRSVLSRNDWDIVAENRKDGPVFIIKKQS